MHFETNERRVFFDGFSKPLQDFDLMAFNIDFHDQKPQGCSILDAREKVKVSLLQGGKITNNATYRSIDFESLGARGGTRTPMVTR